MALFIPRFWVGEGPPDLKVQPGPMEDPRGLPDPRVLKGIKEIPG